MRLLAIIIGFTMLSFIGYVSIGHPLPSPTPSISPQRIPTGITISDPDVDYEKSGAIAQVKKLPEVKAFILGLDEPESLYIEAVKRDRKTITIHVAKNKLDTLVTFNKYKIDKETGEIICSISAYDINGKYLGSGEKNGQCI